MTTVNDRKLCNDLLALYFQLIFLLWYYWNTVFYLQWVFYLCNAVGSGQNVFFVDDRPSTLKTGRCWKIKVFGIILLRLKINFIGRYVLILFPIFFWKYIHLQVLYIKRAIQGNSLSPAFCPLLILSVVSIYPQSIGSNSKFLWFSTDSIFSGSSAISSFDAIGGIGLSGQQTFTWPSLWPHMYPLNISFIGGGRGEGAIFRKVTIFWQCFTRIHLPLSRSGVLQPSSSTTHPRAEEKEYFFIFIYLSRMWN